MINRIFLYGTLIPGQSRGSSIPYENIEGNVLNAQIRGSGLYYYANGEFPIATVDEDFNNNNGVIKGKILTIKPEKVTETLSRLDAIEGVDVGFFERITVKAITKESLEMVECYTYVVCQHLIAKVQQLPTIYGGDWVEFNKNRMLARGLNYNG